jgi:flavin-dependent dehydrogenase
MNNLKTILIAGGGTAGFTAALILKTRFPHIDIKVVRSKKIGIIGVGEGSTEHWNEFIKYIDVPFQTIIRHCDATFKCGIMFRGWAEQDFMHSVGPENDIKNGQYGMVYGKLLSSGSAIQEFNPSHVWQNKVYSKHLNPEFSSPFNQYHFNTNKLNDFLTQMAKYKDILVVDDEILDLETDEQGNITKLTGNNSNYYADFFIDCTGFKKILISKLGAKWVSHSKYLKMKSAIVFPTEGKEEINMWTIAQTMQYGWMFNIPVWERNGNGYIFDSDYITPDQAKLEVEKFLGHDIEVSKHINFDPGHLDNVWIKNCCAIGLSANFIEPLEATSIGTSIQQTFLLMHRLPNYTENVIKKYNKDVNDIMNNIRDFIVLHYMTKKKNSQFWLDMLATEIPDSLKNNLDRWKKNLPIADDFRNQTDYTMFRDANYIQILMGLKLFNMPSIVEEYNMMHTNTKKMAEDFIRNKRTLEKLNPTITHREFLTNIRKQNLK